MTSVSYRGWNLHSGLLVALFTLLHLPIHNGSKGEEDVEGERLLQRNF